MSALPNPLQELAEKLRNLCPGCRDGLVLRDGVHLFADGHRHEQHIDTAEIAASLGTLLQAERAATIKECADIADCGGMFETAMTKAIRDLPADASALSAVVQRETAKATAAEYDRWCKFLKNLMDHAAAHSESTAK